MEKTNRTWIWLGDVNWHRKSISQWTIIFIIYLRKYFQCCVSIIIIINRLSHHPSTIDDTRTHKHPIRHIKLNNYNKCRSHRHCSMCIWCEFIAVWQCQTAIERYLIRFRIFRVLAQTRNERNRTTKNRFRCHIRIVYFAQTAVALRV